MVPRKQAGHMTCTRPQAERQILLAMLASSTHVAVAVANKMARIAWAIMAKGGHYRAPELAAAT